MPDYIKALADVNALAVFTACVLAYVLGALWYSPLVFAKPWGRELGMKEKDVKKMGSQMPMARVMAASFVATLLLSLAIGLAMNMLEVRGLLNGMGFGLFLAAGLILTTMAIHNLFEHRSWKLYLINGGYNVAMGIVIGGVLGAWPK